MLVEGQFAGRLEGFRFVPDPSARRIRRRALLSAANRAVRRGLGERVRTFAAAGDDGVRARRARDDALARPAGRAPCRRRSHPRRRASSRCRATCSTRRSARRCGGASSDWLADHLRGRLRPLFRAQEADLSGAARGIAFEVVDALGTIARAAARGHDRGPARRGPQGAVAGGNRNRRGRRVPAGAEARGAAACPAVERQDRTAARPPAGRPADRCRTPPTSRRPSWRPAAICRRARSSCAPTGWSAWPRRRGAWRSRGRFGDAGPRGHHRRPTPRDLAGVLAALGYAASIENGELSFAPVRARGRGKRRRRGQAGQPAFAVRRSCGGWSGPEMPELAGEQRVDKWLWCARFFKSRTLAAKACHDGRIRIAGQVLTKAHHALKVGDVLTFPLGPNIRVVRVVALAVRRGPRGRGADPVRGSRAHGPAPDIGRRLGTGAQRTPAGR